MKRPAQRPAKGPAAKPVKRPATKRPAAKQPMKRPETAETLRLTLQDGRGQGYPPNRVSMEIEKGKHLEQIKEIAAQALGGPSEFMQFFVDGEQLLDKDPIEKFARSGEVHLELRAPDAPMPGSQWAGEDTMQATNEREGSVWMESAETGALSAAVSVDAYASFLQTLKEDEDLMRLRDSPDNFTTEVNEVVAERSWCRVFRYTDCTIAPDPEQSIEYFDALATATVTESEMLVPLVSSLSCQVSVSSAKGDAWLRILGVVKYDNVSFGILQEYDGEGCLIALRGGELKTRFLVEVLMGFSDALYRGSHSMWMGARYRFFAYRFHVWRTPTGNWGPSASSFHASLQDAFEKMGYSQVGTVVVEQLERVRLGFAENSETKLFQDAREAAKAKAQALRERAEG